MIVNCQHCLTNVLPNEDNTCPACRNNLTDPPSGDLFRRAKIRPARPGWITFFAIVNLFSGLLILYLQTEYRDLLIEAFSLVGLGEEVYFLSLGLLSVGHITVGIGRWLGKKWGWWAASFMAIYAIFRYGQAMYLILWLGGQISPSKPCFPSRSGFSSGFLYRER
jgi:hypothetical protein